MKNKSYYPEKLFTVINSYLKSEKDFDTFVKSFYDLFFEVIPDDGMSKEDFIFFGSIQEKIEWVDENPSSEARDYNAINKQEFLEWLKEKTLEYSKAKAV